MLKWFAVDGVYVCNVCRGFLEDDYVLGLYKWSGLRLMVRY